MAAPSQAIERLQKKLEKEPNSLAFVQLVEEYRKEGLPDEALKVCREGLSRHPNYWSARVALGRIHYEMGDIVTAGDELEKVIRSVPDNLLANRLLGEIYLKLGRPADALKRYRIVQMLTPADREVRAQVEKLEAKVPQPPAPVEEAHPTGIFPAPTKEALQFVELQPKPMTQLEDQEKTLSTPFDLRTVEEEPEATLRVEPAEYSRGDTYRPEEQSLAAPEIDNPSETPVLPDLDEPEPAFEEEASDGDDLAKIASIFLEDDSETKSELLEVEPLDLPVDEEDLSISDPDSLELEQVLEDTRPGLRQDSTQPMAEKQEEEPGEDAEELTTETLAELYIQQGHLERATKIYQKLLLNDPGNERIQKKLKELNRVDALIASAAGEQLQALQNAPSAEPEKPVASPAMPISNPEEILDERRRKITTLENWLAAIRRER